MPIYPPLSPSDTTWLWWAAIARLCASITIFSWPVPMGDLRSFCGWVRTFLPWILWLWRRRLICWLGQLRALWVCCCCDLRDYLFVVMSFWRDACWWKCVCWGNPLWEGWSTDFFIDHSWSCTRLVFMWWWWSFGWASTLFCSPCSLLSLSS